MARRRAISEKIGPPKYPGKKPERGILADPTVPDLELVVVGPQEPEEVLGNGHLRAREGDEPGRLELVEVEGTPEIDTYQTPELLKLARKHTPELLSPELGEKFRRIKGVLVSLDARGFSGYTTDLAERFGEKKAGEIIAMMMERADEKLLGIAKEYGGTLINAEGDGRRIFCPVLPEETDLAGAARRAVFAVHQFQEETKTLPELQLSDEESVPLLFRVGVECTDEETGDLIVTSFGDKYVRSFATFGGVIPKADALQRLSDPDKHEVVVSKAVRQLLPNSDFREVDADSFVLSAINKEDKPELVTIDWHQGDQGISTRELNEFYMAHIPQSRRSEMRAAVATSYNEGRPIDYAPTFDYQRVSTAFTKADGLGNLVEREVNNGGGGAKLHQELNGPITEVLHIVDRNNGWVDRFTGEGVIFPVYTGPSQEFHAVRATVEMQQVLTKSGFNPRSGVSTDYAFSGLAGSSGDSGGTFTCVGRRVNESARLMAAAKYGQVLISGATFRRSSHRVSCTSQGELPLKGVGPIETFLVDKVDYRAGRYAETEKVVGRDKEESQVQKVIDAATATSQSQLLIVEGEPGVGKTAIVSKVVAGNLESGRIYKIDLRADEAKCKLPLSTAKQFIRQLLSIPDEIDTPKDLGVKILSKEMPSDVMERISLLNAVLDTDFVPTDRVKWLNRTDQRRETIQLIRDLFQLNRQSMGQESPLVFLDDWQFIDKQSADLLDGFIKATAGDGIIWAVPTRLATNDVEKMVIEGLKHSLPAEQTHQLDVKPFSVFSAPKYPGDKAPRAAKQEYYLELRDAQEKWLEENAHWVWPLVRAVFPIDEKELDRPGGRKAANKILSRLFSEDVSHGNIFYIQEMLSNLAMNSTPEMSVFVQHPETGKWHFGDYPLPGEDPKLIRSIRKYYLDDDKQRELWQKMGTIVDVEIQKVTALSSNAQLVARAMAILGLESSKAMLLRLTRIPEHRLDMCLEEMLDHGTVRDLDGGNFGFVHRITQETIYGSIAKVEEKHATHHAILSIMEADYPDKYDKLPSKFFHAYSSGSLLQTIEYADLYGRQLKDYGEESGAISVLERGVQAFDELERHGFPDMTQEQIRHLVNEQLERLLFMRFIWNRLAKADDEMSTLGLAHELFHRHYGGEDGREQYPVEWAAYHAWILSDLGLRVGDKDQKQAAEKYYSVALDILKPFEGKGKLRGLPEHFRQIIAANLSKAYMRLGIYYRRQEDKDSWIKARKLTEKAVCYARITGEYESITAAVNSLAIILNRLGKMKLANKCYTECLRLAETANNLPDQAVYLGNQASILRSLGDEAGVIAAHNKSLGITTRVYRPRTRAWAHIGLGSLSLSKLDYQSAIEHLSSAKEFFNMSDARVKSSLCLDLAQCYLRSKPVNMVAARAQLMEAESDDKRLNMIKVYIAAYADYIDKRISLDDLRSIIVEQAETFIKEGMDQPAMDAYRFLGEVIAQQDPINAHLFLEKALKLSKNCQAGVDKKMILEGLRSIEV